MRWTLPAIALFLLLFVAPTTQSTGVAGSTVGGNQHGEMQRIVLSANAYTLHSPINITSNEDFVSQAWPGSGTESVPYMIEGLNVTHSGVCISISDTTSYFEVRACVVSSGEESLPIDSRGIQLMNVTHGSVRDCIIKSHFYGVCVEHSIGSILTNNTADTTWDGFSLYSSDECRLTDNLAIRSFYFGFFLDFSYGCTLANNTATIAGYGFNLYSSHDCILTNNTATYNSFGFDLSHSDGCTVTDNTAAHNYLIGIRIGPNTGDNRFYLNWIGYNEEHNAEDNGTFNSWDDGVSLGNYWSDYTGTGPYHIPGSALSDDHYPFSWHGTSTTQTGSPLSGPIAVLVVAVSMAVLIVVFPRFRRKPREVEGSLQ